MAEDKEYLKFKDKFPPKGMVTRAMIVDFLVVHALAAVLLVIYTPIGRSLFDRYTRGYVGFGIYVLCVLYVPIMTSFKRTLGQKLTKIRVQKISGEKLSLPAAIGRWFFSSISPMGYNYKAVPWFDKYFNSVLIKED